MANVTFAPSAHNDLSDIFEFLSQDKPLAAARWLDTIEAKCELIANAPELGELRLEFGQNIRSSLVGRYVIFYRPVDEGVEILRIVVGERDTRSL